MKKATVALGESELGRIAITTDTVAAIAGRAVDESFGVLTLDRPDQASPRLEKGAEAVRTALEMADLFANLRAAAAR